MSSPPGRLTAETIENSDIAYLTKYVGKLDSGIGFTDLFYLRALARSALSTLVYTSRMPAEFAADGVRYTSDVQEYRRHDFRVQLVNGMGTMHELLRGGFYPEHAANRKVAFIHDEPGAYAYYNTDVWNLENVQNTLMAPFDAFIFVSENCRTQWADLGALAGKHAFTLPNTCAEESYLRALRASKSKADARRDLGLNPESRHLTIVGTVQPRKKQLDAVLALKHLVRHENAVLHLVGRTTQRTYEDEIRSVVEREGLSDRVHFVGQVSKELALEYIYASDALLLPSGSEAMPMVLLEAMLLETPIFATPVGGVTELVTESTGVLFAVGEHEDLAEKLRSGLGAPERLREMAHRALERYAQHYDNEQFFKRFAGVLAELATEPGRPAGFYTRGLSEGPISLAHGTACLRVAGAAPAPAVGLELAGAISQLAHTQEFRDLLCEVALHGRLERALVTNVGGRLSLPELLSIAPPLARLGLDVESLSLERGELVMAAGRTEDSPAPAVSRAELFHMFDEAYFLRAIASERGRGAGHSRAAQELAKLKRTYRWRIADRIAQPFVRMGLLRKYRQARRTLRGFWKPTATEARAAQSGSPCTVCVLNSPLQLMAFLSLWKQVYEAAAPDRPLVALVYSTNGAADFADRLCKLATATGAFKSVTNFTPLYREIYAPGLGFADCRRIKGEVLGLVHPYEPETVFFPAFMSARGQKLLYEIFSHARIRLFEDGLGSYVPKCIKMLDSGIVDRVTSGDFACAHHIRSIETIDLLMRDVPAPPQYGADISRLRFPELHRGRYQIDFSQFAGLLGVQPRAFGENEALLVTQNFSDHLAAVGYTPEEETAMYDDAVERLLNAGLQVIIRPHPRASRPLWSARWRQHPRVEVWNRDASIPLEVLLQPSRMPRLLLGVTSSCLFYLSQPPYRALCATLSNRHVTLLQRKATQEHRTMVDLAAAHLPSLDRVLGNLASAASAPMG